MKIERIEISRHSLPLEPPFPAAWDPMPRTKFGLTVVRIHTDDGAVGIGSGYLSSSFQDYEHLFLGQDPLDLSRHHSLLDDVSFDIGRCWAIDVALWDLKGRVENKPVWQLLGGKTDRLRAYASTGVLRDTQAMADQARFLVDEGYRAIKVRFGREDRREDLQVIESVRSAVGDGIDLMVDCNRAWRTPGNLRPYWPFEMVLEVTQRLDELGVFWMEEPLHRGDYGGMTALRNAVSVRIAGGEMTTEPYEFATMIERGCLDVLQPDCCLTSGITGAAKIAFLAGEAGLIFSPHTWGNGIQFLANAHVAAGTTGSPYIEFPFDPPEWTALGRDFGLRDQTMIDGDGWVVLSDTPGFGFDLDEELLAATRVG
jgi:L-alanine-DL-glutamate epimerase-like enolase superfamily enzyme